MFMLMHLSPENAFKAAKIAASKYFSNDQAIGQEDLQSIALVRILDRDPTTMGAAVHVGREGIMREIKYARYKKAADTVQFSVFEKQDRGTLELDKVSRRSETDAEVKVSRFVRKITDRMGPPLEVFGRFGVAYQFGSVPDLVVKRFRFSDPNSTRLIYSHEITDEIRSLADRCHVLVIITDNDIQPELW